ncbi:MAG: cyclic nucleotide-binding domain-containing protein [Spirochaetaceae bacterium]|jgi:GGDEF domain-containing protein|nr:cyclic nucleotide-binding domain-containing protein [Spirochaetaceae bacterium]
MGGSAPVFDVTPIRKAALFSSLTDREMEYVLAHSGMIQLRHRGVLFAEGRRAEHFYMLLEGAVRIVRPDAPEEELARFTAGDIIGDFDFARRALYDARAEAVEDSALIMFPAFGLTLDEIAADEPYVIAQIRLGSIVMIGDRLREVQRMTVENLSWVEELRRRAYEDPGTGLWRQSFISDELGSVLAEPTALIQMKPDRFKLLVDSRGHRVGDEAMVRIAGVLKNMARRLGRGWPLRFKSNEAGLFIPRCGPEQAGALAADLLAGIAALEPVPAEGGEGAFTFSATVVWGVWPLDDESWESLFARNYALLLEAWRGGGACALRLPPAAEAAEAGR